MAGSFRPGSAKIKVQPGRARLASQTVVEKVAVIHLVDRLQKELSSELFQTGEVVVLQSFRMTGGLSRHRTRLGRLPLLVIPRNGYKHVVVWGGFFCSL